MFFAEVSGIKQRSLLFLLCSFYAASLRDRKIAYSMIGHVVHSPDDSVVLLESTYRTGNISFIYFP